MSAILFKWVELSPIAVELRKPIRQVSLEFVIPNSGPRSATLWRSDGTGLRLFTEMHDVAERREVGVLNFERVSAPRPEEKIVNLASAFDRDLAVSKLTIQESGTSAESGVILKADSAEIVIVAGAYPYSLAVSGVLSAPHIFEPEYPIDRYARVPIA